MIVQEARAVAREWVEQCGSLLTGFCGAFLSGSVLTAGEYEPWPETSDVDIVVITGAAEPYAKPGKFVYRSLLLEVTILTKSVFTALEYVLCTHYLAFALCKDSILADPEGWLGPLHLAVKSQYAQARWVRRRCSAFIRRIQDGVAGFDIRAPFHEQVTSWVFPTGISTFPILAAALQNCTVRKRYTAVRMVLETYGMMEFYSPLMGLLTGGGFRSGSLPGHLAELEKTFDLAAASQGPSASYPYRGDISPASKAIAIDGCGKLIASSYPMEAVFWMAVTFARCHAILCMDVPEGDGERLPSFRAFMSDMGIDSPGGFESRNQHLLAFLPEVERIAEVIIQKRATVPLYD